MQKFILTILLASSLSLCAEDESTILKRIHNHILIKDKRSACDTSSNAYARYPYSKSILETAITAQADAGNEQAMFVLWQDYVKRYPEEKYNRNILENMAWAILHEGSDSPMPLIRAVTLLAALYSQDAKGVNIIEKHLHDDNASIRRLSVKLSSELPDAKLQQSVLRLLKSDPSWHVRLEAIKAVGNMNLQEAKNDLFEILSQAHPTSEEKAAAIESLVTLLDDMDRKQLEKLIKSPRAGLRQLACEIVEYLQLEQHLDLLRCLVDDPHPLVRAAVLETIGRLRPIQCGKEKADELLLRKLGDSDPQVAITAAWALTLYKSNKGLIFLEKRISDDNAQVRLYAAGALAATGKYGSTLISRMFDTTKDPYVKLNLALALINLNMRTTQACDVIYQELSTQKDRWMWNEKGLTKLLTPCKNKESDLGLLQNPEEVNQLVCLELFNLLAVMDYPQTQQGIKRFLQDRKWSISAMASLLLLTEGDEASISLVEGLLNDSSNKVRLQAALILALWGRGGKEISLLEKGYASADRETKEHILESLGRIGAPSSIEFLTDKLKEPSQTLRMIAASSLLQALYH